MANPLRQTNHEWLAEYSSGGDDMKARSHDDSELPPKLLDMGISHSMSSRAQAIEGEFSYLNHRTTKQGRVVLEFVHTDTGVLVAKFFNVDVRKYRTGDHGQFTVQPRHKFRKFWLHMVGCPPGKWCRVHQEMYKLKSLRYRGRATYRTADKVGYWNLEKVRKL